MQLHLMRRFGPGPCLAAASLLLPPGALSCQQQPRCIEVEDLVQWERRVAPSSSFLALVRERLPDLAGLTLRHGHLLLLTDDAGEEAVHAALAGIRHETGEREVGRAAAARRSLLRDYHGEYGRILVKATWTGPQTVPVPGLAVHGTGRIFSVTPFRAFRRERIPYGNDDLPVFRSFAGTEAGMEALVRTVLEHPVCEEAMVRSEPSEWSLTFLDTTGARRPNYLELLLDRAEARRVFAAVQEALPQNPAAREVLADLQRSY